MLSGWTSSLAGSCGGVDIPAQRSRGTWYLDRQTGNHQCIQLRPGEYGRGVGIGEEGEGGDRGRMTPRGGGHAKAGRGRNSEEEIKRCG